MVIKIKNLTPMALSESDGTKLRIAIMEEHEKNKADDIVLDFDGIQLFASMFFNASIGYLIINNNSAMDKIKIINITNLGQSTYNHSVENARNYSKCVDDTINNELRNNEDTESE